jgi:TonB family protein
MSRLAGKVTARVYISATGSVDTVEIVKVQPRGGVFEQAALEALRQVRYQPAQIGGQTVNSQKLIEVTFNPYEEPDPSAN